VSGGVGKQRALAGCCAAGIQRGAEGGVGDGG